MWLGQPKCNKCGWFGHVAAKCFRSGAQKRKYEGDQGGKQKRTGKEREQAHCAAEDAHSGQTNEGIVFTAEESAGVCNFDTYDPKNNEELDERLIFYYMWLADTATTFHIANSRTVFDSFETLKRAINGVGNASTYAEGKGTVNVQSKVGTKTFCLTLHDVLYVPTNQHNLLSLG